ncbi:MAG: outer membrane beta-barrel protein [Pseudomonadales bacterium]|nr:outer membrane beta-barrel protein [Pseudomonadales bacterium]
MFRLLQVVVLMWAYCAQSDELPFYAAGSLNVFQVSNQMTSPSTQSSPSTAGFLLGYSVGKYVGVEAQGMLGLGSASANYCNPGCSNANVSVLHGEAVYLRASLPWGPLQPYVRVGMADTNVQTIPLGSVSGITQTLRGAAVGAGLGVRIDAKRQIYIDLQHLSAQHAHINVLGLGYFERFSFTGHY